MVRWGRFGTRQRYRCCACERTFSDFTGTALARLRRADLWPAFCRCMLDGLTVRKAAARIGVHRDTAFRWRHRLLRELRSSESYPLGPRVGVGETFVYGGRDWLLVAIDERGRTGGRRIGAGAGAGRPRCVPADVAGLLDQRLDCRAVLLSTDGRFGPIARFARDRHIQWSQRRPVDGDLDAVFEPIAVHGLRFRRWLRRFRGVAGHYLDNYLGWFRLQDESIWSGVCRGP